jgi:hypothetical protein
MFIEDCGPQTGSGRHSSYEIRVVCMSSSAWFTSAQRVVVGLLSDEYSKIIVSSKRQRQTLACSPKKIEGLRTMS